MAAPANPSGISSGAPGSARAAVTISMARPDGPMRQLNGIVRRFAEGEIVPGTRGEPTFVRYRAEVVPKLWLLSRNVQSRIFQQMTVPDILMAVLSGLEQASGGEVRVAGIDYGPLNEDALALARRGRIGIVLQSFHLLPTMNALENVAVPMELAGMDDPFGRAEAELTAVGLGHRLRHYPAQLSGGEQQRVAIARAVAPRPDIIFADEPTGNLDGATGAAIIDLLFARKTAAEATMVIITHDPALARRCDRIVEMLDGRVALDRAA